MQMSGFIIRITFNLFGIFEGKWLAPYLHFMTGKLGVEPGYTQNFSQKQLLSFIWNYLYLVQISLL